MLLGKVPASFRAFSATTSKPIVKEILHGSKKAQAEGAAQQQHSAAVGRGKYIHEIQRHKCHPSQVESYKEKIANYYKGIADSPEFQVKLTGSFEVIVGDIDSFVHIWEYDGLVGFESVKQKVKESQGHLETFNKEILPLLSSRSNQLTQEFSFWGGSSPPVKNGGIYELRSYQLKPGALLEWESEWVKGLIARQASGNSPIGAWFSQIGRLHQVHHMWHYPSLEARRLKRAEAWKVDGWAETVSKTVKLTQHMDSFILRPLPFSPIA